MDKRNGGVLVYRCLFNNDEEREKNCIYYHSDIEGDNCDFFLKKSCELDDECINKIAQSKRLLTEISYILDKYEEQSDINTSLLLIRLLKQESEHNVRNIIKEEINANHGSVSKT